MYNFVIFGNDAEYHLVAISDVVNCENVRYYKTRSIKTPLLSLINKLHTTPRINKFINLPFKSVWNSFYFKNDFKNDELLCFIFYANNYWLRDFGYFKYLKQNHPNCKLVMLFNDLVDVYYDRFKNFDIEFVKDEFDLVISYNKYDVDKYQLDYSPGFMSKVQLYIDEQIPSSDVFFVGAAKDRLELIIQIYEKLTSSGLKCDFHINGVSIKEQKYTDKITYNKWLSYREVLKRVAKTKCNLEVSQKGTLGVTFRTIEALIYNKKLLSNNPILVGTRFYDKAYVHYFESVEEINIDIIKDESVLINYDYNEDYSPLRLLEFIERKLQP